MTDMAQDVAELILTEWPDSELSHPGKGTWQVLVPQGGQWCVITVHMAARKPAVLERPA